MNKLLDHLNSGRSSFRISSSAAANGAEDEGGGSVGSVLAHRVQNKVATLAAHEYRIAVKHISTRMLRLPPVSGEKSILLTSLRRDFDLFCSDLAEMQKRLGEVNRTLAQSRDANAHVAQLLPGFFSLLDDEENEGVDEGFLSHVTCFCKILANQELTCWEESQKHFTDVLKPLLEKWDVQIAAVVAASEAEARASTELYLATQRLRLHPQDLFVERKHGETNKAFTQAHQRLLNALHAVLQERFASLRQIVQFLFLSQTEYHFGLEQVLREGALPKEDEFGEKRQIELAIERTRAAPLPPPAATYGAQGPILQVVHNHRRGSLLLAAAKTMTRHELGQKVAELFGGIRAENLEEAVLRRKLETMRGFVLTLETLCAKLNQARARSNEVGPALTRLAQALQALMHSDGSPDGQCIMALLEGFTVKLRSLTIAADAQLFSLVQSTLESFSANSKRLDEAFVSLFKAQTSLSRYTRLVAQTLAKEEHAFAKQQKRNQSLGDEEFAESEELTLLREEKDHAAKVYSQKHESMFKLVNDALKARQRDVKPLFVVLCASHVQLHCALQKTTELLSETLDQSEPESRAEHGPPTFMGFGSNGGQPQLQSSEAEEFSPLERMVKPRGDYKVIIIGETGCGKSTLV